MINWRDVCASEKRPERKTRRLIVLARSISIKGPLVRMSFFGTLFPRSPRTRYPRPKLDTILIGERVLLRVGDPVDWHSWRAARESSRDFLAPWEPTWPNNSLTYNYFCAQLHRHWREWRDGKGYAFQICLLPSDFVETRAFDTKTEKNVSLLARQTLADSAFLKKAGINPHKLPIVGGIALSEIVRGIAQKGTIGYWIEQSRARQGLMREATQLTLGFAYGVLKLHRVEATCLPNNEPSRGLLTSLGFEQEGLAKSYLRINGQWADHALWGRVE